jgi:glycine/D-amino acid oxidase-like deaminating enzyme
MPYRAFVSSDFKQAPVWRDGLPAQDLGAPGLADRADVLVVGAGFTGLVTALNLARGGREVLVVDAEEPGHGCSTRNGGQVSSEMKPDLDAYEKKHGPEAARRVLGTGVHAHRFLRSFIAAEGLDCDYAVCGHFIGAHREDRVRTLAGFAAIQRRLGVEVDDVSRADQHAFVGSDHFHGGISLPDWSSIHPGRYHAELLRLALAAGVRVVPHARVDDIADEGAGVRVKIGARTIVARDVVIGTDGYTGRQLGWFDRRMVSVASFVMATEPLDPARLARLYPRASMVYDTRKNVSYHRPSPDGRRVIFGSVVPVKQGDPLASLPRARSNMLRVFPDLADVKISHAWFGMVGATFDHLPHIGSKGRVHYAMGYNGTGIAMSTYLGTRLARRMLGAPDADTGLDGLTFQTRPFYRGKTWFIRPLLAVRDLKDRLPARSSGLG